MTNIDETWRLFFKTKDEKARGDLIKHYLPVVKYQTDRIASHLPAQVRGNDKEDLYIEGVMGLMEALERFDPARNIKFETFASKRIRGAILDTLRREDILPKNIREHGKRIEKAYIEEEARLGRLPDEEEICKKLGMTKNEFYAILNKLKGISVVSMDSEILNTKGEKFSFEDVIGEEATVLIEFEREEARNQLASFIEILEKEERQIVELYYWEELTLKEIGTILDISESRVCQIRTNIMLKLRSRFRKLDKER